MARFAELKHPAHYFFTVSVIILCCSFIKNEENIPGLILRDCEIIAKGEDTTTIAGVNRKVKKYEVNTKVTVQTACYYTSGKWEEKNNQYIIYTTDDSSCIYFDSVYSEIGKYWVQQEEFATQYNPDGDFSVLPVYSGFYQTDSLTIPWISTGHEREGAYAIAWFNKKVYKIVLKKSGGMGGLSSFMNQKFILDNNGKELMLKGLIRKLAETKAILADKKGCIE